MLTFWDITTGPLDGMKHLMLYLIKIMREKELKQKRKKNLF